jgi:hypothetical protein
MKSEIKLRVSYEKQKALFESSKEKKIQNIDNQIALLQAKVDRLKVQGQALMETKEKLLQTSFRTFEDFQQAQQEQVQKDSQA